MIHPAKGGAYIRMEDGGLVLRQAIGAVDIEGAAAPAVPPIAVSTEPASDPVIDTASPAREEEPKPDLEEVLPTGQSAEPVLSASNGPDSEAAEPAPEPQE